VAVHVCSLERLRTRVHPTLRSSAPMEVWLRRVEGVLLSLMTRTAEGGAITNVSAAQKVLSAALSESASLTADQLRAVAPGRGIGEFPTVLTMRLDTPLGSTRNRSAAHQWRSRSHTWTTARGEFWAR
jgi:hypothetical protein